MLQEDKFWRETAMTAQIIVVVWIVAIVVIVSVWLLAGRDKMW